MDGCTPSAPNHPGCVRAIAAQSSTTRFACCAAAVRSTWLYPEYGTPRYGGRTIVAQTTHRDGPATATVWRTIRRKSETAPGSSFVPTLRTTTRGSDGPSVASADGASAAWRLTSVEERKVQSARYRSR